MAVKVVTKEKVCVRIVEPINPPQRCPAFGKKCHNYGKDNHYKALCRSCRRSNSQQNGGRRSHHEVEQDDKSQNEWTFSLNQEEVVIQFTDSVTKVKVSHNVMFDEIELPRVLVDLNVQSYLYIKMKTLHLSQVKVDHYTNSGLNLIVVLMVISYQSQCFKGYTQVYLIVNSGRL